MSKAGKIIIALSVISAVGLTYSLINFRGISDIFDIDLNDE